MAQLKELKASKEAEIAAQEMRIYADGGDLVPDQLQDATDQIVAKVAASSDLTFELG